MITIKDKTFETFIPESEINFAVEKLAQRINHKYAGKTVHFVSVLNGAFMFTSDLMKKITVDCCLSFVKVKSYHGTESTGTIRDILDLDFNPEGKIIVILEDIVDTGLTISYLIDKYKNMGASSVDVAAMVFKREAYRGHVEIELFGIEIPNRFIVGYGLDYDDLGRNYKDIYILKN